MDVNKQTMGVVAFLGHRRYIEILVAAYDNEEEWIDQRKLRLAINVNDGSFRNCMELLETLGLAERQRYSGDWRSRWRLTDLGCCVASIVKEKVLDIDFLLTRGVGKNCEPLSPLTS